MLEIASSLSLLAMTGGNIMKQILLLAFVLIFSACSAQQPQVIATHIAEATVTPLPTATFTPITPEPTDTLTPIPTATPFRYTSCVDKALIAEEDKAFEERTGIVLNNPTDERSLGFRKTMEENSFYGFEKGIDIINFPIFKTGVGVVEVENVPGINKVVCLFGRNSFLPETVAVATGWYDDSGKYTPFTIAAEVHEPPPNGVFDGQAQLDWMKSLPDGALIMFDAHTFSGVTSIGNIKTRNSKNPDNVSRVKEFVQKMLAGGNDLLGRYSPLYNKYTIYWLAQDSTKGDVGFIPSGYWRVFLTKSPDLSR